MKTLVVICFLFLGIFSTISAQVLQKSTIVNSYNEDEKTVEVKKSHLTKTSFSFQEEATSFKIKIPRNPSYSNMGSDFDTNSLVLLEKAQKGDYIVVFDIKYAKNNALPQTVYIKVI